MQTVTRWYHYIAYFFGGAFLANTIPHLVNGISGSPFQSPFASPPGEGLSSATTNVLWGMFNLVVAYNSLMDVDDMPTVVREVARVLRPGGRLCVCVTHPTADAGKFASEDGDAPFVIAGSYLGRRPFEETGERNGVAMTFSGWAYPLEAYFEALEAAGLLVETVREPAAVDGRLPRTPAERRWSRVPIFLFFRAVKAPGG
jgi:SAM-dependent methyltransferase